MVADNGYSTGPHTVDTNTQLTEAQVDAMVSDNGYSTGPHTVDTNTQLTEAQVDAMVADNGYSTGPHTINTNTQLTNAEVATAATAQGFVTGPHTINTNTQLNEAQVDAMVADNGYSTGPHTINTNTQLNEAQVDAMVADNGYSTGPHTVDTNTQLTETQVESYVTNQAIDLAFGSTVGGQPISSGGGNSCPAGMLALVDSCIDMFPTSSNRTWQGAISSCAAAGRRLCSPQELVFRCLNFGPGSDEWSGDIISSTHAARVMNGCSVTSADMGFGQHYRCCVDL
jgi:GH24 family phage-related lysozyme (muramidase)